MRLVLTSTLVFAFCIFFTHHFHSRASQFPPHPCKAWLVQSIPTDMPHLSRVPGVLSTGDVLRWLAANSTRRLDIIAQYWQLVASPNDSRSGDYGYSETDMRKFGAHEGAAVYEAIDAAADRNVSIRLLSHSGVYPDFTKEPSKLASGRPNVKNVTLLLGDWWGSGIVHAKVWISDNRDVYIGSANNDWKSLTQAISFLYLYKYQILLFVVKEVGIYLTGCPGIAKKVEVYFNNLWTLSSLNSSDYTKTVFDQQWQVERKVPCWSHFIDFEKRCRSPLPQYVETPHVAGYPVLSDPYMFKVSIHTPGNNHSTMLPQVNYLSFAPPELSFGKYQADEQAWIDTIKSVGMGETVRINTMDWLGQSQYTDHTVYWSSLSSAVSEVVFSKQATVKILVAYWAHFINNTDVYLKSLLYSNNLCSSSKYNKCSGKVEIKYYEVPGFNLTGPAIQNGGSSGNKYPGFTRVNHGKYAVSDVRAHIGTSNLIWDYFYTTAGVSFGTYNPDIVSQLQQIFDADWHSPYAVPVEEREGSYSSSF
ncbi:phospholipase D Z-like [Senna tora]|uniref:Phospholipase D Z-like n=1 Tax=Senna tora TaxID=362788 RepID=A0A834T902_9FABA|nr:phospholipase D Z-like [Senna tora]